MLEWPYTNIALNLHGIGVAVRIHAQFQLVHHSCQTDHIPTGRNWLQVRHKRHLDFLGNLELECPLMRFWRYFVGSLEYRFFVAKQGLVSSAHAAVGGLTAVFEFVVEGCFEEDRHGVYFYFCRGRVDCCSFDCLAWFVVLWLLWISMAFAVQQDAEVVLGGILGHIGGDVVCTRQRRCLEIPR